MGRIRPVNLAENRSTSALKVFTDGFNGFVKHMDGQIPAILYESMHPTFRKSQTYCPFDTGKMLASGYMELRGTGRGAQLTIGYGKGGHPSYTAMVHENLEVHHAAPTRAKWLQVAIEEDSSEILRRVAANTKRAGGF